MLSEFLDSLTLRSVSPEAAEALGGPVMMQEITNMVKRMAQGKVVGTDCLPVEFYSLFEDLIFPNLVDL